MDVPCCVRVLCPCRRVHVEHQPAQSGYRFGLTAQTAPNAQSMKPSIQGKVERKAAQVAEKVQSRLQNPQPGVLTKLIFTVMRRMQRGKNADYNPKDRDHWRDRGWTAGARPWKG